MLCQLSVQGLAIIDSLSIALSPGFNVITGETGAGKSILIKALNLLLGGKVGGDAVRQGYLHAVVTGEFVVPHTHVAAGVLEALGVPLERTEDSCSILIRRQLTAKGRSQSWVNDVPVTGQPLRELGMSLVDIFGQHENQRLMDGGSHIHYIDAFLKDDTPRCEVKRAFAEVSLLMKELEEMLHAFRDGLKARDYVGYRVQELRQFVPSAEDYHSLKEYCELADLHAKVQGGFSKAAALLDGGEDAGSPAKALREVARVLGGVEGADALKETALKCAVDVDDLSYELGKVLSKIEVDEERLEGAQKRLFGYQDLFRKHSVRDVESLMAEAGRMESELAFLEGAETKLCETMDRLVSRAESLAMASVRLTEIRRLAAKKIKKRVETELHELAMPGAEFLVELIPVSRSISDPEFGPFVDKLAPAWAEARRHLERVGELGAERGQFLLASNPGEPSLPLERIASGGELSRIMLALKKALAADAETCVLVFDEIDSGISGRVADVVGKKMRDLSQSFQVVCISHLPQVAVYADTHFLVRKEGRGERTESRMVKLSKDDSAREIARLLSGAEVSRPSLENARSLIKRARDRTPKSPPARSL